MFPDMYPWLKILLAAVVSFVVAFIMTPPVKAFAEKVGAIDVPKDDRRIHDHPIPRMGGIAIFIGFMASMMFFCGDEPPHYRHAGWRADNCDYGCC